VANWAVSIGLKQGDVVALLMDNRPEFVWTWLGLAKIGVVISFINHNLTGKPLIHSLSVCKANNMIIGANIFHSSFTINDDRYHQT
jgi:fatty-acyl-CoA synthase